MGTTHNLACHGHQRGGYHIFQGAHEKDTADAEPHSEQAVVDTVIEEKTVV